MLEKSIEERSLNGLSTTEVITSLSKKVSNFVFAQYKTLNDLIRLLRSEKNQYHSKSR